MGVIEHGVAMGVFLGLGYLLPRDKKLPLVNKDLLINVATGGAIFVAATYFVPLIRSNLEFHFFSLPFDSPWLHLLVSFLLLDFTRYWLHFAHHRVSWLWTFHRVHHSAEKLDSTTGLRMHIVDFIQLAMIPITMFSVIIDTTKFESWVIPVALGLGIFFDAFVHANMRFNAKHPFWRFWGSVLNTPHFHVWHHNRDGPELYGNYGNVLVIWDRLFGTVITKDHVPPLLGISADQALKNDPVSLQLLMLRGKPAPEDQLAQ